MASKVNTKYQNFSFVDVMRYGFLALPLACISFPLYINAPDFYIQETGLSLALVGAIMLFTRIFDAVQDPLIGFYSQKYSHHRDKLIYLSVVLMMLSFYTLFHPWEGYPFFSLVFSVVVLATCFSILSINLNSIGSLWGKTADEKLKITTGREIFTFTGLLLAILLPFYTSYSFMTFFIWGVLLCAVFFFYQWNKKFGKQVHQREGKSFLSFSDLKSILKSIHFKKFIAVYVTSMIASAIPAVLIIFFVRDYLGAESYIGLFLLLYFVAGGLSMFFWQRVAASFGMARGWLFSMILAVATFSWAYFLMPGDIVFYAAICLLSGLAFGAELTIPPAILSVILDKEKQNHLTSIQFSLFAFLLKISLAFGTALAFFVLETSSFVPGEQNTEEALQVVLLTYTVLPISIKIGAGILMVLWLKMLIQGEKKGDKKNENDISRILARGYAHA